MSSERASVSESFDVRGSPQVPQSPSAQRYTELDALRGLAALTVVLHHFRLMWELPDTAPRWFVLIDPVTAGYEAVILFFLLSGFVLSVPYLQGKGQPYNVYLLRRMLRIYAPYLCAVVIAVIGAIIWHGPLDHGGEWASRTWLHPVDAALVTAHVMLIGNYDWAQYNTAFWSLVVEMRISIVFPFLFFFINRLKTVWALVAAALMCCGGEIIESKLPWSAPTVGTVVYAAVFVSGIILAMNIQRVNAWFLDLGIATKWAIGVASLVLYTFGDRLTSLFKHNAGLDIVFVTVGAVGYMIMAINAPWAKALLQTVWARFLGRISYSWYLVHGTVLFALTHSLGNRISGPGQFAIYLPATIIVGYAFCRFVEEPFLRMSQRVAKSTWAHHQITNKVPLSGVKTRE